MKQSEKFEKFKALHARPGTFIIPNPWNAGTARMLSALGFEALATTSAGYAFSVGRRGSSGGLSRNEVLKNAQDIVNATDLPVSADLENGFGRAPETCAETIQMAAGIGLVGGSIEDATGTPDEPIYDFELAVERVAAACEAARSLPMIITARTENFIFGRPNLDDTIKRLQAFAKAGADVVYAPGLPDIDAIRLVCDAVDKPVNVVMGLRGATFSIEDLQVVGVKRVSVGGAFARAALGGFMRAATEIREHGTFKFADQALSNADTKNQLA